MKNIRLMCVYMPPEEELMPQLKQVLYSGVVTEGTKVVEFEKKLQQYLDCSLQPLSTNSGTATLQLALRCANVKNKIVLATPMTCFASNAPIIHEQAKIVWCDINPKTGNISVKSVEENLKRYGEQVAAVLFVDFAGYPAELDKLIELKRKYNIKLIEDAAQSLGAGYYIRDLNYPCMYVKKVGAIDEIDFTCLSHQAVKHLTTIDGGSLICSNQKDWEKAKKLKWFGINREAAKEATRWHYDIEDIGYKFHMNNVNATVGIVQLDHTKEIVKKHFENGIYFDKNLKDIPGLETMEIPFLSVPSYWIYMVKVEKREEFAKKMLEKGISVNVAHIRNDKYSCFKHSDVVLNNGEELEGLKEFNEKYISIPCNWSVSNEDREYIVDCIKQGW